MHFQAPFYPFWKKAMCQSLTRQGKKVKYKLQVIVFFSELTFYKTHYLTRVGLINIRIMYSKKVVRVKCGNSYIIKSYHAI